MQDDANTVISVEPEDVEMTVPLDTVCFIVAKAQDAQVKAASTSDEPPDEDSDPEAAILEDRGVDPVELELTSVISDLSEDGQADLVALMWLGRDGGDWGELRALAAHERGTPTAEYMLGTPLLADYLLEGLNQIGLDCSEWFAENG